MELSSCWQKPFISSLPQRGSPSTPSLSTVTSCPSFHPPWGLGSCFCNVSLKALFIHSDTMQSAHLLSQLLHLLIQCLNDSPPSKSKDMLSSTLGRGTRQYLQLKAPHSLQSSLWVKASDVPKTVVAAGSADYTIWQADAIDEQDQGIFNRVSRPLCNNRCSNCSAPGSIPVPTGYIAAPHTPAE